MLPLPYVVTLLISKFETLDAASGKDEELWSGLKAHGRPLRIIGVSSHALLENEDFRKVVERGPYFKSIRTRVRRQVVVIK